MNETRLAGEFPSGQTILRHIGVDRFSTWSCQRILTVVRFPPVDGGSSNVAFDEWE